MKKFKFFKEKSPFTFTTGKYRGKDFDEVKDNDYLMWYYYFHKNKMTDKERSTFVIHLHHAGYAVRNGTYEVLETDNGFMTTFIG
jgi:hypothetical protein